MQKLFFDHALLSSGWTRDVEIAVHKGTIVSIKADAPPAHAERVGGIALAGLPNLHSHTFQRGMAGLAETRGPSHDTFWTWRQTMYRFLTMLTPDDVEAIAAFAMMEMLEGGFSSVGEFHYLHHQIGGHPYSNLAELSERIAAAASLSGIGLTLLPVYYQFGGFGGVEPNASQLRFVNTPERFLQLVERCRAALSGLEDSKLGIAPHSLRAVTPETLKDVLASSDQCPIHIHVAEQLREVDDCIAWCGRRPVQWLIENADVDIHWCLIHATHATRDEIRAIAKREAVVGLCPITESNLGDGIFAGVQLLEEGGRFGVGSDSNVEIGGAEELRQLEYSQRLAMRLRNVMTREEGESTARRLYYSALAGGRQALGRKIGSLAEGFRADIVTLRADHPDLCAVSNDGWLDAYVFSAGKAAIDAVFVGGRQVVSDGRHLKRGEIRAKYARTRRRLLQS